LIFEDINHYDSFIYYILYSKYFFLFLLVTFHEVALGQQCPMRLLSDDRYFFINNIDSDPVSSDGDNNPTAVNNIPLKVCPQQPLTLKDLVNGGQSRSFEITQNNRTFYL
jgi:hypothetical protein